MQRMSATGAYFNPVKYGQPLASNMIDNSASILNKIKSDNCKTGCLDSFFHSTEVVYVD